MNLKNKLLIVLLLPYLIIGTVIITCFLNYNTKTAINNEKNILNAQVEMLIELLKPYIINNQTSKINDVLDKNIFIKDLNLLFAFQKKIYFKGNNKYYNSALNLLKGLNNSQTNDDFINIVKPIKIGYSNYVWGKIVLIKKTYKNYLHKQTKRRLIIPGLSVILIITLYIFYISYLFYPLKQIRKDVQQIMRLKKNRLKSIDDKHYEFSILAETINNLIKKNMKEHELLSKKTASLKADVDKKTKKMTELVNEQLKKTEELNNLRRDYYIAQKNNSLYILMSGLAHEINNPLTMVVGNFDYLLYKKNTPEELKKWLNEKMKSLFVIKDILQKAIQINTAKNTETLFYLTDFINGYIKNKKNFELTLTKKSIVIEVPKEIKNLETEFEEFLNSIENSKPKKVNIAIKQKKNRYLLIININYNKYIDEIDYRILFSKHLIGLGSLGDVNLSFKDNNIMISIEIEVNKEEEKK